MRSVWLLFPLCALFACQANEPGARGDGLDGPAASQAGTDLPDDVAEDGVTERRPSGTLPVEPVEEVGADAVHCKTDQDCSKTEVCAALALGRPVCVSKSDFEDLPDRTSGPDGQPAPPIGMLERDPTRGDFR